MCVCVCVCECACCDTADPLSPVCADSRAPEEQRVITGLNGLNKHDNGRSAVRQSEVRR